MDEGKREKGIFRKIGKVLYSPFNYIGSVFYKIMTYDYVSGRYTNQVNENMTLSEEVRGLTKSLLDVSEKYELAKHENEILREEKISLKKSDDCLQQERDGLQKKLEEAEVTRKKDLGDQMQALTEEFGTSLKDALNQKDAIIGFERKQKRKVMKFADYVVREKSMEPLEVFLNRSKIPYFVVDPKTGNIIGYNKAFERELEIAENLRGQSYLRILDGTENVDKIRFIRKFLDIEEEKSFDIKYKTNGKVIPLHIKKEPPIHVKLDLTLLGKGKEVDIVTCVPLIVEKIGKLERFYHHGHSLEDELEEAERIAKELEKIYPRLIHHGWRHKQIMEKEREMGPGAFYYFCKREVAELDAKEEKKKLEEARERLEQERQRKIEKRRLARERLIRMKANPRRPKAIVKRLKARGIENEKLMDLIRDDTLSYQDFRYSCSQLVRQYRTETKEKEQTKKEKRKKKKRR